MPQKYFMPRSNITKGRMPCAHEVVEIAKHCSLQHEEVRPTSAHNNGTDPGFPGNNGV